jgi:hypothetical protein
MDWVQIATNLAVVMVGGWVAGVFGVRYALKKAQRERALDREVKWLEKAIHVTLRFKLFNQKIAIALRERDLAKFSARLEELTGQLSELLLELQDTINDSLLYATPKVYRSLKKVFAQVRKLTDDISAAREDADLVTVANVYDAHSKALDDSIFVLAKNVRKMLKLGKISRKDFAESFEAGT